MIRLFLKKVRVVVFGMLFLLAMSGAYLLGWLTPYRQWERSTGWDRVPDSLRPSRVAPSPDDPEIFWLGHSGFFIRWQGVAILVDPNLSDRTTFVHREMVAPISPGRLPKIDALLLTHAHFDHWDNPTIEAIPDIKAIFVPQGSEKYLSKNVLSAGNVHPITVGPSVRVGNMEISAVPALHSGGRYHPFRGKHFAVGYVLTIAGKALYISGDTAFGGHFTAVKNQYHPHWAILPIGGYSPRFLLKYHHLDPGEAVLAAKSLGVERVIPCHFGTFRVAFDRPETALREFSSLAMKQNVTWEMPVLLTEDELKKGIKNESN